MRYVVYGIVMTAYVSGGVIACAIIANWIFNKVEKDVDND